MCSDTSISSQQITYMISNISVYPDSLLYYSFHYLCILIYSIILVLGNFGNNGSLSCLISSCNNAT